MGLDFRNGSLADRPDHALATGSLKYSEGNHVTHNAFSDLVLCVTCMFIAFRNLPIGTGRVAHVDSVSVYAGMGIACLVIGIAAALGVVRFSDWSPFNERMHGPHRIASTFAAVGAFPLLAYTLAHRGSPISRRVSGAWWFTFVVGGLGLGVWLLGFKLWAQIVPALSGIWMFYSIATSIRGRNLQLGALGLIFLLAAFLVTLMIPDSYNALGVFSSTQLFHYFLATALFLIAFAVPRESISNGAADIAL
jgi:hypothetical protein